MSSRPTPGQPGAKVENKRRNVEPLHRLSKGEIYTKPLKSGANHSLELLRWENSSLHCNHSGMGAVIGVQLRKDALYPAFNRLLADG